MMWNCSDIASGILFCHPSILASRTPIPRSLTCSIKKPMSEEEQQGHKTHGLGKLIEVRVEGLAVRAPWRVNVEEEILTAVPNDFIKALRLHLGGRHDFFPSLEAQLTRAMPRSRARFEASKSHR